MSTTIEDLQRQVGNYLPAEEVDKVLRAYDFGAKAHEGQQRMSGEPYIHHPLEVAQILAGMHMDHQTLIAAILHDVIEDTETAKVEIQR
ncbi:MAG TPA: HD domain-containing protein, partial [Gammaproteobacteria bacterium]